MTQLEFDHILSNIDALSPEQTLNLDEPGAWDWLAGRLTAMIGAAG